MQFIYLFFSFGSYPSIKNNYQNMHFNSRSNIYQKTNNTKN